MQELKLQLLSWLVPPTPSISSKRSFQAVIGVTKTSFTRHSCMLHFETLARGGAPRFGRDSPALRGFVCGVDENGRQPATESSTDAAFCLEGCAMSSAGSGQAARRQSRAPAGTKWRRRGLDGPYTSGRAWPASSCRSDDRRCEG